MIDNGTPSGFTSVTPHLTVKDAKAAMAWYEKVLGAREIFTNAAPDGRVMHARMEFEGSYFMLNDEFPEHGAHGPSKEQKPPIAVHLYTADADALFARMTSAGAEVLMPPMDMFWGDRFACLRDPFGHQWSIATAKEEVSPEQMRERLQAHFESGDANG